MRKRTSDYSSDTDQRIDGEEEVDISLLRCPPAAVRRAAFAGFKEAKSAYEHGPDEIRRLLLHECNLIYECNACRNMFRSLSNFISHKRSYCFRSGTGCLENGNQNGFSDSQLNSTEVIKDIKSNILKQNKSSNGATTTHGSANTNGVSSKCDSSSPTQRLGYERDPTQGETKKLKTDNHNLGIKAEVDQLISKMETVLTPVGGSAGTKSVYNFTTPTEREENAVNINIFGCNICKVNFTTEKALKIHKQKKHGTSSQGFQCPACPLNFMQPQAVIRHLAQEHNKSVRTIRMMRESIVKRRLQPREDEAQVKHTKNRELKRLQSTDNSNSAANGGVEGNEVKIMSSCMYCEKSFERRAALSTHLMSCRVRMEAIGMQQTPQEKRVKPSQILNCKLENPSPIVNIKKEEDLPDANVVNEMFANLDKQTFGVGLKTVTLDKLEMKECSENELELEQEHENENQNLNQSQSDDTLAADESLLSELHETPIKVEVSDGTSEETNGKDKSKGVLEIAKQSCRCKICNKRFDALSNLRRHISMFHYRARKFGCTLCDYRAFRRYDIVNHLGFLHKMTDDRETMSEEYVSVHEVHYSKEDMDGDIILITDEQELEALNDQKRIRTYEKRSKRKKLFVAAVTSLNPAAVEADGRQSLRQRLKRSHSATFMEMGKSQQRRPIRNRIRPENKDFVYDLTNLVKEEPGRTSSPIDCEHQPILERRQLKRRNTLLPALHSQAQGNQGQCQGHGSITLEPLLNHARRDLVRGTAQRLTLELVQQGLAASATSPELPAERPQMRPRLTSTCRVDMQAVPVIETCDLEAARLKSTLLKDSFLEKISKNCAAGNGGFKIKPCLELQHSALDTLLQKVDSSYVHKATVNPTPEFYNKEVKLKIYSTPATPIDAICELSAASVSEGLPAALLLESNANTSPEATVFTPSSPPSAPRKRLAVAQRLIENKGKQRDSLLRSALEN